MRFGWQVRPQDRRTRIGAAVVATALTLGAVAALSVRFGTSIAAVRASVAQRVARAYERITFVMPAAPGPAPRTAVTVPRPVVANQPASAVPPAALDTASRHAPDAGAAAVARPLPLGTLAPAGNGDRARTRLGPILAPSAVTAISRLTPAQQDSIFALSMQDFVRRAMQLKPTQAQKDSSGREQARLYARARDEMRPVPIPLGGGMLSFGLPLFSRGPSREQRRRDSIVHQDNLQRLGRLALRVKMKADSARRADSIASLKVIAVDSMEE